MGARLTMQFEFGNLIGSYFTEWRILLLKDLARQIFKKIPKVSLFKIWYDAINDYHKLEFAYNSKHILVWYYKVLSCSIDGKNELIGCPIHDQNKFVNKITNKITQLCELPNETN